MELISLPPKSTNYNLYFQIFFENKYHFSFLSPTFSKVPNVSSLFEDNKFAKKIFEDLEFRLLDTQVIFMKTNNGVKQNSLKNKIFKDDGEVIYDWFIDHNKLSGGKFDIISNGLYCLSAILDKDKLKSTIDIEKITRDYHYLNFKEKVERAELADHKVYEFLEEMYENYS